MTGASRPRSGPARISTGPTGAVSGPDYALRIRTPRVCTLIGPDDGAADPSRVLWFGGFMLLLALGLMAWIVFGKVL